MVFKMRALRDSMRLIHKFESECSSGAGAGDCRIAASGLLVIAAALYVDLDEDCPIVSFGELGVHNHS